MVLRPLYDTSMGINQVYMTWKYIWKYIIKIKIHSSCEIEYFVETHLCKLCVILRYMWYHAYGCTFFFCVMAVCLAICFVCMVVNCCSGTYQVYA